MELGNKTENVLTLDSEIRNYVSTLPYWGKYLANQILSGHKVTDDDISYAYLCLLEDLQLKEESNKPEIILGTQTISTVDYKSDLFFSKLEKVEGVNALVENQTLDFSPNLTIIYGANGSGKSGYVRLLKQVFYSKARETILPNINIENGHKPINAKFTFKSNNKEIPLGFSDKDKPEFKQFAVFDGRSVLQQLETKNEFEFKPAGLSFFADYTNAVLRVEEKLNADIQIKRSGNTAKDFADLFDHDSEIKTFVQHLNAETKSDDLKKYTPFSEEDRNRKIFIQKQYDELVLAYKGKENEIKKLNSIKELLIQNKKAIEKTNHAFSSDTITKVNTAINDCIVKESAVKKEGLDNFQTDRIQGIGTEEWKNFILSAEKFARTQKREPGSYPETGDFCILCQQPLSDDAQKLISNYWIYVKSVAELNARQAQEKLDKIILYYKGLNFDIFPQNNILTEWLNNNYPKELELLREQLNKQKILAGCIVSDIQNRIINERTATSVGVEHHTTIESAINAKISSLNEDEQCKALGKLLIEKTFLEHKEKYNTHFSKFETYVNNQVWINKANKANFAKRNVTQTEKALSNKYFNQKYINFFNEECQELNGNFGIEINHTGSAGKSYRQLKLKGKNPNAILSEGEQKVIAIADFLAEMNVSECNKGLVFDDPVTSLDNGRKRNIANRLAAYANKKQVIVFSHDLVFVSELLNRDDIVEKKCHWIENRNNTPGYVWLNNSPSHEKEYRNAEPVKRLYSLCNDGNCEPMLKEIFIKQGFTALRTCYEVLVINGLFSNVVQRYNERISIDNLSKVVLDKNVISELQNNYDSCCRFMEGHSHSDNFQYQKPTPQNLNEEIQRYETLSKKIKEIKKTKQ